MGAIPGMMQDLLCISKLDTSRHFLKRWTEWCYFLNETRKFRLCDVLKRSIRVIRNITRAVWDLKRRVEYYIKRSAECADKRYRAQSGMILDTRCIIFSTNKCRETILFSKKKNCSSQLDTSRKIIRVVWDIKGRTDGSTIILVRVLRATWKFGMIPWNEAQNVLCYRHIFCLILIGISPLQMKELVVVYVEIEPFAVLPIGIVHNEIYLSGSFFRVLCRFRPILRRQNPLCKHYRSTAVTDEE